MTCVRIPIVPLKQSISMQGFDNGLVLKEEMIWSVGEWSLWERFGGVAEIDQFPPILPRAFARFIPSGEISDRIWGGIWWYDNSEPALKVVQENTHRQTRGLWRGSWCTMFDVHLDVGHSKGWHLGHGDQGYHLQVKEHVNIGNIESTFWTSFWIASLPWSFKLSQ